MTQYSAKAAIPYAELTDAPNMQTYAQGLSLVLDNAVLAKYSTVTDRNTANPAPTAGDICYCADTDLVYLFSSTVSAWISLFARTLYKPSDTSRSSTVTLADDPHLTLTLEASSKYYYTVAGIWNVNSTGGGGLRANFTAPAGATVGYSSMGPSTSATSFNDSTSTINFSSHPLVAGPSSNVYGTNLPNVGTGYAFQVEGIVITASAGTFAFSWAQNISSGNATTVNMGASMTIQKFA